MVKNTRGKPVFAANIFSQSAPENGVTTDFDGKFSLDIGNSNDTLVVSFIGYETKKILLSSIDKLKELTVVLRGTDLTLEEIIITTKDPISEQFSVVRMEKMDIYFNPMAQGDPLKAITALPASTTVDETANPSLRGSSPDRSRVMLNGVPIYNPVRSSQLNNQGFFSLFNPEMIDKQYVYASNPPLTYGNTSAGLVEIQTLKNLMGNQLQLSASLASTGFMLSQNIKKNISFVQAYGNYQFSDAFVGIQKEKLPYVNNFYTKDAGINFHQRLGKKVDLNSYNYFIDEQFDGYGEQFTFKGKNATNSRRFFTVNNLRLYSKRAVFSLNIGADNASQHFRFGNINSRQKRRQLFTSMSYEREIWERLNLHLGISHDFRRNSFRDDQPLYYYALSPDSPSQFSGTSTSNHLLEGFWYAKWDINDKWLLSSGMRKNLPVKNQKDYLSCQLSLRYQENQKHTFLLSGGRYHSYSQPSYYTKTYRPLFSHQVALDYSYELEGTKVKAAIYFKDETGEQPVNINFSTDRLTTFGLEFFCEHSIQKHLSFFISNALIDQKIKIGKESYHGPKDLNYLIKAALKYNNPDLFSMSLIYNKRPGTYYTEVAGATLDNQSGFYRPMFSVDLFNEQYGSYGRLDIGVSKYMSLGKNALIAFASLNNVFNTRNERTAQYNQNYSIKHFDYYQLRTVYIGLIWQLNY
ncbi:TonB-dependent receptor plug domain-containing protein [Echinicola soli]|uniref:TonB-dependent receptor plug domain-containing protein n=1 Tax=Echinicola soli TaxID=2591634 RepID=UPI00143D1AA5|nr:carboxypeptidase-like regulatory domain-containing protein [Echinicola soli]